VSPGSLGMLREGPLPLPALPSRPQIAGARRTGSGPTGSVALSGCGCDEGSSSAIAGATALFTSHR